jgi:simple sugar transport system permease protein
MVEFFQLMNGLLTSAILAGGVLAIAGIGETLSQKAGVFNLGLEGFIALGAVAGFATVFWTGSLMLGCLAAAAAGAIAGSVFATATVLVRANQVTCGLAFMFLGLGVAALVGQGFSGQPSAAVFAKFPIFRPAAAHYFLSYTRFGISLRAVGENPAAADAAGVPVEAYRFGFVVLGCVLASLAGAYLTLVFVPAWSEGIVAGRGWITLALVIFASFRPALVVLGALLFGFVTAFGYLAQARGLNIPSTVLSALPYLVTLAFMLRPLFARGIGGRRFADPPAALGVPFYRDER